jgi:hypothetical protein
VEAVLLVKGWVRWRREIEEVNEWVVGHVGTAGAHVHVYPIKSPTCACECAQDDQEFWSWLRGKGLHHTKTFRGDRWSRLATPIRPNHRYFTRSGGEYRVAPPVYSCLICYKRHANPKHFPYSWSPSKGIRRYMCRDCARENFWILKKGWLSTPMHCSGRCMYLENRKILDD